MRFYCPRCWRDFAQNVTVCPHCGLDIEKFWKSKDYVEKLILALQHPEKETPMRAAWLLGQLKDMRAVPPLIALIKHTDNVYIARAAVEALGEIDTPEARRFLGTLNQHPAKMVRDEVRRILAEKSSLRKSKERSSYES